MVDFDSEMQIMDDDLTQRNGLVATATLEVAAGIVEKWWRQHLSDFEGGAVSTRSRASG